MSSQEFFAALRTDARKGPAPRRKSGGKVSAESSPPIQIAKRNRTTGEPVRAGGTSASARPAFEDAIWHSEMKRKVVAGGVPQDTPSDISIGSTYADFILISEFGLISVSSGRGN